MAGIKRFRPRRGKTSTLASKNPILLSGELIVEVPEEGVGKGKIKIKMGDGKTKYNDLPYAVEPAPNPGDQTINVTVSSTVSSPENMLNNISSGKTLSVLLGNIKKMLAYFKDVVGEDHKKLGDGFLGYATNYNIDELGPGICWVNGWTNITGTLPFDKNNHYLVIGSGSASSNPFCLNQIAIHLILGQIKVRHRDTLNDDWKPWASTNTNNIVYPSNESFTYNLNRQDNIYDTMFGHSDTIDDLLVGFWSYVTTYKYNNGSDFNVQMAYGNYGDLAIRGWDIDNHKYSAWKRIVTESMSRNWIDITKSCNFRYTVERDNVYKSFLKYNPHTNQVVGSINIDGTVTNQSTIVDMPFLAGIGHSDGANQYLGSCGIGTSETSGVSIHPRIWYNTILSSHSRDVSVVNPRYTINFIIE